ncbi:MAG: cation:proton antiporter [Candidatus Pacebacteria bacterium]|nr:cation:proton antiporter [Candidatus Paceibacterota bacterium]
MGIFKKFGPYIVFLAVAVGLSYATHHFTWVMDIFSTGAEGFYLALALLLAIGYGLNFFAPKTAIPSFVWAILFGMALQLPLAGLTANKDALFIVIQLLAAFVLFAGGVEVPIKNFKKYFAPIAALAFVGTVLTVFFFTYALTGLTGAFGFEVPIVALLVLAAILASTDPTAIIPTLDLLQFRKPFLRDIAISESAVNDVVGTILTRFFLVAAIGTSLGVVSVSDGFAPLVTRAVLDNFALELLWGALVGLLGAWILKTWGESIRHTHWSDPALFFAVPIFCFALGSIVGGSGFLAAFVAGLLFEAKHETKEVRVFFETLVDRFMKPIIFILLGALVPMGMLLSTMSIGVSAAIIFMFVIRPAVVFITLLPWMYSKNDLLGWREVLFLSFVRETGAIPAILILSAVAAGLVASEFIFAVGMWVILLTLVIEPPLTPLVARRLAVAR